MSEGLSDCSLTYLLIFFFTVPWLSTAAERPPIICIPDVR